MKTALVTGASSGIGAAIARQLIADGYRVFVGARRVDRMRELVDAGATALSLDVTDDASIVAAMNTIRDGAGRLDVLVNNAGYGSYGSLEEVPIDEARRQFEVNVFGLARLTQLALPMMRAQKSGTVVNITSIGGKIYEPFGAWYHASKFAVEGMSDSLRMELAPFGINVVIIEPGAIKTEWTEISRLNLLQHSGSGPYKPYAESHANMLAKADRASVASPPEVVAATVSRALKARRPHTRYATGSGAADRTTRTCASAGPLVRCGAATVPQRRFRLRRLGPRPSGIRSRLSSGSSAGRRPWCRRASRRWRPWPAHRAW